VPLEPLEPLEPLVPLELGEGVSSLLLHAARVRAIVEATSIVRPFIVATDILYEASAPEVSPKLT
jgi:hypothetical protein